MHGTFRSELGDSAPDWADVFASEPQAQSKSAHPLERSVYGTRRTNWTLIGFILAIHAMLLAALVTLDVIPIHQPKAEPLVVTLMELKVEPPPQIPAEKVPPSEEVKPHLTTPVQIIQTPIAPIMPVAALPTPPQPPVIAPPAPAGPVKVNDLGSKMITLVTPRYPMESRRRKEQGTVFLLVTLGADGIVSEIHVSRSSGYDRLDKAALDAVRKWRWSPTIRNGQAVAVQGTVDIPFTLTA